MILKERTPCYMVRWGSYRFGKTVAILDNFGTEQGRIFRVENLAQHKWFLDIELVWSIPRTTYNKQTSVITRSLAITGILGNKTVGSTADSSLTGERTMQSEPLSEERHSKCRSTACSLFYLAIKKRSELCIAASMPASNMALPRQAHITGTKHALRYLNDTAHNYVATSPKDNNQLTTHAGASWGAGA